MNGRWIRANDPQGEQTAAVVNPIWDSSVMLLGFPKLPVCLYLRRCRDNLGLWLNRGGLIISGLFWPKVCRFRIVVCNLLPG